MATINAINNDALDENSVKDASVKNNHPIVGDRVIEGEGTSKEAWHDWHGLQSMARLDIAKHFPAEQQVYVFAPHPDDEILGCGGLLQQLAANGNTIVLVHVTSGTQSHPNSQIYPPEKLNTIRPQESSKALKILDIQHQVTTVFLDLADGEVFAQQQQFYEKLSTLIHSDAILVTPFVHDGHPDHEATGQVVAAFARQQQLVCYQVLIWAWHWAKPNDDRIPWHCASRVDLSVGQLQRKIKAINCFKSQISVDESTGNEAILSAQTIARISQPWEVYLVDSTPTKKISDSYAAQYFDEMYSDNTDPWQYQTRWYEKRKRDMCLAVLTQANYTNAIEIGCGNGVFSELLAERCQALLCLDGNHQAVQLTKQRLLDASHVKVMQGVIPDALANVNNAFLQSRHLLDSSPINNAPFDLILISEILYYLSLADIEIVIDWIKQNLAVGGTLLCCHWRYPIDGFAMTGDTVHERLKQAFNKENKQIFLHQSQIVDSDFLLDVWRHSNETVAMQEHLV